MHGKPLNAARAEPRPPFHESRTYMDRRNLELKIRLSDPSRARAAMITYGATPQWTCRQADTHFHAPHGRLKLREFNDGQPATLIAYRRPDASGVRASDYRLVPLADPAALKLALTEAL